MDQVTPPGLKANVNEDDFGGNAQTMNAWFNRVRLWLSGMQYGGARDMYAVLGYTRFLQQHDYVARYLRQDMAQRLINQPVMSTWADPPEILADQAFSDAWQTLTNPTLSGINVWQQIIRLDKLAGLGQFALLVFGFDDGQPLDRPLTSGAKRKILYLQPYAEAAVRVREYNEDNRSPRFGLPEVYTVSPGRFRPEMRTGNQGYSYSSEYGRRQFDVHASRVLHVAEGLLEDPVYGRSRLEVVTNLLDDLLKIVGGGSEAFWLVANRGMQIDVDKEMDLSPDDQANLQQEVEDYQHEIRRFIRTRGVKINPLAGKMTDPQGAFNNVIALLSAASGIPQSILVGSSRGETVSQQDRAAWSERVSERVTEYADPVVLRPFLDVCINAGTLPKPTSIKINWPEAFKLNPLERAQTSAQMARSASNLSKSQDFARSSKVKPLFTDQEARRIVSFDNRMPVFEHSTPSETAPGSGSASPAMPGAQPDPVFGVGEQET